MKDLELRITSLEKQHKTTLDSLNTLNTEFIKPFKTYEKIVLDEFKNSPTKTLSDYEDLIEDYPNSFWKHEAKKRMENIERREKHWTEKNGWKFPEKRKKSKASEIVEIEAISCPGC